MCIEVLHVMKNGRSEQSQIVKDGVCIHEVLNVVA